MKKLFIALVMVVLVSALVFGGCPSTTPTTTAPAPTTTAPKPEPIVLTYSESVPPTSWAVVHALLPWQKEIEELSGGRVKFENYFSNSLSKDREHWETLQSGITDMATVSFHYWAGLTTFTNVVSLPFLDYESSEHEAMVAAQLLEKFPEIRNEYKDNKLLLLYPSTPFFFITTNKLIQSRDDFNGLKLRIPGEEAIKIMLDEVGVVPISTGGPDIYPNLEKGVMDGTMTNWDMLQAFRLHEVVKNYTFGPFNAGCRGVVMSNQAWNKLPADIQDIFMSVSGEAGGRYWGKHVYDESVEPVKQMVKDSGYEMNVYTFTPEQVQEWKDLSADKIWGSWITMAVEKAKAEGYPNPEALAQNILDTTQELVKTYKP